MSEAADHGALPKRTRDLLVRMDDATAAVDKRLFRLGKQGLQRLTWASVVDLRALAKTAHNGGMIRVERELEALATWVARYIDRDPLFTLEAYMACINRVFLLNTHIRQRRATGELPPSMVDVLGQARRTYTPRAEPLHLQSVGASGWVTDTGYVGVTVFLWSLGDGLLMQATNAKPTLYFGDDPRALLNQSISEGVDVSVGDLAHGAFIVEQARTCGERLSLHKDLVVKPGPWRAPEAYQALGCADWGALIARLRDAKLRPLDPRPIAPVYIEPVGWGPLVNDAKRQEVRIALRDARGGVLDLSVPMRPEYNRLIDNLEVLDARGPSAPGWYPTGLLGRPRVLGGRLRFMPLTAVYPRGMVLSKHQSAPRYAVHLSLDDMAEARL